MNIYYWVVGLKINNNVATTNGSAMCSDGYSVRITVYLQRYRVLGDGFIT
ncbi:MAG: hypothetical protein WBJ13_05100 [Sedimentibacter sp.]